MVKVGMMSCEHVLICKQRSIRLLWRSLQKEENLVNFDMGIENIELKSSRKRVEEIHSGKITPRAKES